MRGVVVLQGGGPFTANDELDREVLAGVAPPSGTTTVVVLPTADAFERPQRMIDLAATWADRHAAAGHTVDVQPLMVLRRAEAQSTAAAATIRDANAVYVVGDQPLHLRSVLKDTPCWEAMLELLAAGGAIVGVGGAAAGLCDPMVDPRGGAVTLGLGLVNGLALVTQSEQVGRDRLQRTDRMTTDVTVAHVPTGAALVRRGDGWTTHGQVTVRGELPQ